MKIINYAIMFVFLISIVSAQEVQITKTAPQSVKLGDIVEIKINILNPYSTEKEFIIEETLPRDMEIIEPTNSLKRRTDGLEVDYYKWNTMISSNKIKTLSYKIRLNSLGEYTIGETVTMVSGLEYYSNTVSIKVNCNPNGQCSEDENYLNCPQDCETGLSDGICDYKADGICDPDCTEDPDCEKTSKIGLFNLIIYISGGIIILILGMLFIPKLFKKKINNNVQQAIQSGNNQETNKNDPLSGMGNNQ
jgi:hypothetical protein